MLVDSLTASFTGGGTFDFEAAMSELGTAATSADFGTVRFDATGVLGAVADLAPPDVQALIDTVGQISTDAGAGVGDLVSVDTLLDPIRALLDPLSTLGDGFDLSIDAPEVGITALSGRVDAALELVDGPLEPVVELLRSALPDLDLTGAATDLTGWVGGAIGLVQLVGGLLAVDTVATKVHAHSNLVAGMLNRPLVEADAANLIRRSQTDLAARIGGVDPLDTPTVDATIADVADFVAAVRNMEQSWSEGLGLGEAALIGLDAPGCAVRFATALAALDETRLAVVGELATAVRAALEPVLAIELPSPKDSLDATFAELLELTAPLRDAITGLDTARFTETITGALTEVTAPIDAVVSTLDDTASAIGSGLRSVGDLVDAIDLTPLTTGIADALAPITTALDAVEGAVADGQAAIETVAAAIETGLGDVTAAVGGVATSITDALGAVSDRLATIDFAEIQAVIENGLGTVASKLASAELSPYFDAANSAIDTTADVIDAVPFGLLPTDVQQEIVDLSRPVKDIDFAAIATNLRNELAAIVDALDTTVLDEIDAAYQAVVTFLHDIDPGAAIAEFEAGPFAELRATVDSIDPEALLAEVDTALAPIRTLLDGIDLRDAVLTPVADVFADIRAQLDALDPAVLLADAVDEVDRFREQIVDDIRLDDWATTITESRDRIVELLGRVDLGALAAVAASGAITRARNDADDGPGAIGQIVSALVQASGLPADAESWTAVKQWFGDAAARASLGERLSEAAMLVGSTEVTVGQLDPAPAVNAARNAHRALLQAVRSHPDDSRLRLAAEPLLVDNSPAEILAPLVDNHARYHARLAVDARAMSTLASSGTSQVDVIADGLVDALLPVTGLSTWVRDLLGRFGLGDVNRPWPELLSDVLDTFGPDRIFGLVAELVESFRDKVIEVVDALLVPVNDVVGTVETAVGIIDLHPIVDELSGIHAGVVALVDATDPAVLVGPVLDDADAVIARVAGFDPLEPVRAVIDALRATIDELFDTVTPSVVFAPAIEIFDTILALAEGLDVRGLLGPILDALVGLGEQLDVGIEETAVALKRLQDALPDRVEGSAASASGSVSGGLSL